MDVVGSKKGAEDSLSWGKTGPAMSVFNGLGLWGHRRVQAAQVWTCNDWHRALSTHVCHAFV